MIEMIIKMVKEFKLTVFHWRAQTRCKAVHARGFTGPPGHRAVAGRGPRAAGTSGRRAAGPWRAVGRGPLGRGPAFSKTQMQMLNMMQQQNRAIIELMENFTSPK